jgi:hypothetical protein
MKKLTINLLFVIVVLHFAACTASKVYPKEYYEQHKEGMQHMEQLYNKITNAKLIALAFNDLAFNNVSLEFKTDSVRYIYDFNYTEQRMNDSLLKFGYDTALVQKLLKEMRKIKCTWINTLDYYVDGEKKLLLFMSAPVRQLSVFPALQKRKYYLFNFYAQPQYYDEQGRLLDKVKLKRLRKISNEIFWRINDKVCYTVSGKFR